MQHAEGRSLMRRCKKPEYDAVCHQVNNGRSPVGMSVQDVAYDPKHEPHLSLRVAAEVTNAWVTRDPGIVAHLDAFHPYTSGFAKSRLSLKGKQQISVLVLRCYTLQVPAQLENTDDLWGCFSWVDLNDSLSVHARRAVPAERLPAAGCSESHKGVALAAQELIPALTEAAFEERRQQLLKLTADMSDLSPLELPT